MAKVLVVDDDDHIREVVTFALEKAGMTVVTAADGRQALAVFAREQPDLLILDIMMPELDGLDVCRAVRQTNKTPILFLTARDEEVDLIVGLELGGDDYVTKPFSPRQLVARARAILRRIGMTQRDTEPKPLVIEQGQLYLDSQSYCARWGAASLTLTATEFRLLMVLASCPNKVFSREELMQKAYDNVVVSDRTIDSHIRRVRHKVAECGGEVIETVHGFGYRIGACK